MVSLSGEIVGSDGERMKPLSVELDDVPCPYLRKCYRETGEICNADLWSLCEEYERKKLMDRRG